MRWLALAPIVAALALASCAIPGASAQTLDAQTVLQRTQAAAIKDITFSADGTVALDLGSLAQATGSSSSSVSVDTSISGKITTSPQRADLTASLQGFSVEVITDAATKNLYLKLGDQWLPVPAGDLSTVLDPTLFTKLEQLTQAKNIGSDNINGTSVWHLQGQQTFDGASATEDFYVRQDNYYPVKVTVKGNASVPTEVANGAGGAGATANITINVTNVNSGISIALPATN
jgi:hypothetical protein